MPAPLHHIHFFCAGCGHKLKAPFGSEGHAAVCTHCGYRLIIPRMQLVPRAVSEIEPHTIDVEHRPIEPQAAPRHLPAPIPVAVPLVEPLAALPEFVPQPLPPEYDHAAEAARYRHSPATRKQKDFAASLGIPFREEIGKGELGDLIDEALAER